MAVKEPEKHRPAVDKIIAVLIKSIGFFVIRTLVALNKSFTGCNKLKISISQGRACNRRRNQKYGIRAMRFNWDSFEVIRTAIRGYML